MPFSRVFLPNLLPSQLVLNSWILMPLPIIGNEEELASLLGLSRSVPCWPSAPDVSLVSACGPQGVLSGGGSVGVDHGMGTRGDTTTLQWL